MGAKTDYDIDNRSFHIEKQGDRWVGWFVDRPNERFSSDRKMKLLRSVGYLPAASGVTFAFQISEGQLEFLKFRHPTMQEAFSRHRQRVAARGTRRQFNPKRPLNAFDLWERDAFSCIYCGRLIDLSHEAHLDHIVPLSHDGLDTAGNLAVACAGCNLAKGATRLPNESSVLAEVSRRNALHGITDDHPVGVDLDAEELS